MVKSPIDLTDADITTEVSPWQPENAWAPIEVTDEGMTTEVSPRQSKNAWAPIEVTDEGMTTEVRESWNALSSMLVTELGIMTEETCRSFIARARADTFSDECIKISSLDVVAAGAV